MEYITQHKYPNAIKKKIEDKRKLRRLWQSSRHSEVDKLEENKIEDKRKLNNATRKFPQKFRNECFQIYREKLTSTSVTNYCFWKVPNRLTRSQQIIPSLSSPRGDWSRCPIDRANLFASHLAAVFKLFLPKFTSCETEIFKHLQLSSQASFPVKFFSSQKVNAMIDKNLNSMKTLGHDMISDKVIKELPKKGIALMTYIFNVIIHFWLLSILVETVNHYTHSRTKVVSYQPFSLLLSLSKLSEKQLSKRLRTILDDTVTTPNH